MSYFARLAQRSAISPLRPVAQQPAAPVALEQHMQTPESVTRPVERPPQPGTAPPEPKAGHDLLATPDIKSLPLKGVSAVDVIESFAEQVSNAPANARLPEPEERPRATAATMAAERPVRREPATRADARHSSEAAAAAPRAQDARGARSATRPSQVIALSEVGPTEALPQHRDDTRGAPPRRPPPRPSLEQTITRDAAARRTENSVEIHIGRISLQVSTPQPAAPAPVPLRESFAPHRHYLRLR